MVIDPVVLFDGGCNRRRTLRAHRTGTSMGCVATLILCDYPTRDRRATAKFLDSCSLSNHRFLDSLARFNLEGKEGSSAATNWTCLLCHHACLEWRVLHSRNA